MFRLFFDLFLLMHVLGDFYFQGDKLSEKKQKELKYVLLHSLIYLLVSLACTIPFWSVSMLISAGILSALHFAADSIKFLLLKSEKLTQGPSLYIVDQLVHLVCMAGISAVLVYNGYVLKLLPPIEGFLSVIMKDPKTAFIWPSLILMALKPANITIKQLVSKYKPDDGIADNTNKAGAFIGTLERLIILLLLSAGQYSAIGLVLTAKSVARYNKISEDKQFAEYYLLGTLVSALYAIGSYFIFM